MKLFNLKRNPQNRIQKFAKYRRQIMKMKYIQAPQAFNSSLSDDNRKAYLPTVRILMWMMGGVVIILLILVLALVYFGR